MTGNSSRLRIQMGAPEGGEQTASPGRAGSQSLRTLTPSASVLDKIAGAPASDVTALDDVEEGAGTYLNTREWKYSSFFNRIKQTVGMHWDPNTVVRQRDPTGGIFLYKDRYTILTVVLDDKGGLKTVAVDKSCGVDFLDREAVSAFRRSQPFPNPPPGLQNSDGEIALGSGSTWRPTARACGSSGPATRTPSPRARRAIWRSARWRRRRRCASSCATASSGPTSTPSCPSFVEQVMYSGGVRTQADFVLQVFALAEPFEELSE